MRFTYTAPATLFLTAVANQDGADRTFAIVKAIGSVCRTPEVGEQSAIGVRAAACDSYQPTDVAQHSANEMLTKLAQSSTFMQIVEEIFA